jgi:predicted signal transduction protein with EAL and GGDEF domain
MKAAQYLMGLKDFASVPRNNLQLLIAQYRAFSYQIPLMYAILLINTWALSVTHIGLVALHAC